MFLFLMTHFSNDIILYIELIVVHFLELWLFQQFRDIYTQKQLKIVDY